MQARISKVKVATHELTGERVAIKILKKENIVDVGTFR